MRHAFARFGLLAATASCLIAGIGLGALLRPQQLGSTPPMDGPPIRCAGGDSSGTAAQGTGVPVLFTERPYTAATLAEAVNHFVDLGEDAAVRELHRLCTWWFADIGRGFDVDERIGWVCRILFEPKGRDPLRQPFFGALRGLPWPSMPLQQWPLYPVARSGSSYFVLGEGYVVDGVPEDPHEYIEYCRANGTFRREPVPVPSHEQAVRDALDLRQSAAWKSIRWLGQLGDYPYAWDEPSTWDAIERQAAAIPAVLDAFEQHDYERQTGDQ